MLHYWSHRNEYPWSLNAIYQSMGMTKQGFHKQLSRRRRYEEEVEYILLIVRQIRVDHPTMCCRLMYYKINPVFLGRDRFEAICRDYGFMVRTKKSPYRTTDSSGVKRFDNYVKGLEIQRINQVWSSDITYFEIENAFYYLTFIIDCYTRRILGHAVSNRLLTEQTTLPALRKAIKVRGPDISRGTVFHSDGGGQYYDQVFLDYTAQYGFINSMCTSPMDNGIAERQNGVIKNNYLKHWDIKTIGQLTRSVDRAVKLYNEGKPHTSLGRKTPIAFEMELANLEQEKESMVNESYGQIGEKIGVTDS